MYFYLYTALVFPSTFCVCVFLTVQLSVVWRQIKGVLHCFCPFNCSIKLLLQKDVSKYSVMIAEEDADIDTDLPGEPYTMLRGAIIQQNHVR
jgi:hypothetical protein